MTVTVAPEFITRVRRSEPMSRHTSWHVGGPAEVPLQGDPRGRNADPGFSRGVRFGHGFVPDLGHLPVEEFDHPVETPERGPLVPHDYLDRDVVLQHACLRADEVAQHSAPGQRVRHNRGEPVTSLPGGPVRIRT